METDDEDDYEHISAEHTGDNRIKPLGKLIISNARQEPHLRGTATKEEDDLEEEESLVQID